MSHKAQKDFCKSVKKSYPNFFRRVNVIDVGSLDINGNNRGLFSKSHYVGIDVENGDNVDVVGAAHEVIEGIERLVEPNYTWNPHLHRIEQGKKFDVVISTEALEHDKYWDKTLQSMYDKLRSGGLLLITCAGNGRAEHGTSKSRPQDSPATNDYYANVSNGMFASILQPYMFDVYFLRQIDTDLQFYGIKI